MKRYFVLGFIIISLLVGTTCVYAYDNELKAVVTNIKLFLNDQRVDKEVIVIGESSYLPVRAMSEALGLDVTWDGDNMAIYLKQKQQSGDDAVLKEFGIVSKLDKENKELKEQIQKLEKENKQLKQNNKTTGTEIKKPSTTTQNNTSSNFVGPTLTAKTEDGKVILNWTKINSEKLQGYKVVISKDNSKPKYPDDGYLFWITDKNKTSAVIDNTVPYNNGKFKYLTPGGKYYFSITAVYSDIKVPGNVVTVEYPKQENNEEKNEQTTSDYTAPQLTVGLTGGKVCLNWTQINDDNLQGYKVVMSKNNCYPKYPDDGYLYWFPDRTKTNAVIEAGQGYTNGDFKCVASGEKYYISITALYNDKKVAGNVLEVTIP